MEYLILNHVLDLTQCLLIVRVGGERVLFFSATSWALVTFLTPPLAHLSSHTLAFMTLTRFLMGLLQGEHYR